MSRELLSRYRCVLIPETQKHYLSSNHQQMLDAFEQAGGAVIVPAAGPRKEDSPQNDRRGRRIFWGNLNDRQAVGAVVHEAAQGALSRFEAPWTVQVHADWQAQHRRIMLHLVNYNRREDAESQPRAEAPIGVDGIGVDLKLPAGARVVHVGFLTPQRQDPAPVEFTQVQDRLRLRSPGFLVYGFLVVTLDDDNGSD